MSIYLSTFLTVYIGAVAFIFGTVMGSFLNCTAIRVLNGEPIARGRSHCMSCGHVLSALDLIPLFSWIFLKGKCRYCGEKISARYPLTELILGVMYVLIVLRYDLTLRMAEMLILASLLFTISLCDLEEYIIPDRFIVIGIAVRILCVILGGDIRHEALTTLLGAVSISVPLLIVSLIMDRVLKKESMGGGDIKLYFMAGMYFPVSCNILSLIIACIAGIAMYFLSMKNEEKQIPFGPAIAVAYGLVILAGTNIINWYLGLF